MDEPDDFTLSQAHELLDRLKTSDAVVILKALGALDDLLRNRAFGTVSVAVVAGKCRQVALNQTFQT